MAARAASVKGRLMTTTPHLSRRSLLGLAGAAAGAGLLSACGSKDDNTGSGTKAATINWWHIGTADPGKTINQKLADDYHTQNPNVTINITILENEAFKSKLKTINNPSDYPHIFQSWGGGVLKEQVEAGLIKDITSAASSYIGDITKTSQVPYTIDGKLYGLAYNSGMVGFWYNTALFAKAGITKFPDTWEDFLGVVTKLKAAGVTPISIAAKDKWPVHFYWSYLAMRYGGLDLIPNAVKNKDFSAPEFIQASNALKALAALEPFQKGYADTAYTTGQENDAAFMGNGLCAMELMGQWAPSTQAAFSTDKKGQGDKIKFAPFPTVAGGKGKATDIFGGTDGFAISAKAPKETTDYLKYLLNADSQKKMVAGGGVLPVNKGAADAVSDPEQKKVQQTLASGTGFQLYLDQAYAAAIGTQVNDSTTELIVNFKTASAEAASKAITNAAKSA
jgi:raffinose/stachyose/melibiose transport system substrate-binding protein